MYFHLTYMISIDLLRVYNVFTRNQWKLAKDRRLGWQGCDPKTKLAPRQDHDRITTGSRQDHDSKKRTTTGSRQDHDRITTAMSNGSGRIAEDRACASILNRKSYFFVIWKGFLWFSMSFHENIRNHIKTMQNDRILCISYEKVKNKYDFNRNQ